MVPGKARGVFATDRGDLHRSERVGDGTGKWGALVSNRAGVALAEGSPPAGTASGWSYREGAQSPKTSVGNAGGMEHSSPG